MRNEHWFSCSGNRFPDRNEEVEIRLTYSSGDDNVIRGYYDSNDDIWVHDWYAGDEIDNPICWRYIAS
jgi:hypothetical protein